jgi:hypothetical protein
MTDWHTEAEKRLIEQFGGEPKQQFGPDGMLSDDPVEVRLAREEDRFRLNQDTHQQLMQNDGSYLFDDVTDKQPPKQVPAESVDDLLQEDWHSDRGYLHQFVDVDEVL